MNPFLEVISDVSFIKAMFSSLFFILLAFLLVRFHLVPLKTKEVLNELVMKLFLPALAFTAFFSDFNQEQLFSSIGVFLLTIFFYLLLFLLSFLCFLHYKKEKAKIYSIFSTLGQLTFFSIPLLKSIYSESVSAILIPASLMTIAFRLFLYLYSYIILSGEKLTRENIWPFTKKILFNPIIIMMFLGMILFLIQNVTFQVDIDGISYGFLRIDKTAPFLYEPLKLLSDFSTPACMMLVGATLASVDIKNSIKKLSIWFIALFRSILSPLLVLAICLLIHKTGFFSFDEYTLSCLVIGFGAPMSAVIDAYASHFHKEEDIASGVCFLSTVFAFVSIPLCFTLIKLSLNVL